MTRNVATTLLKTCLFFGVVSILVDSLLSPLNKIMHFCPVKAAVPPLKAPMYGVLQCLVIGLMLFWQHFMKDQTSGKMIVRDQDCGVGAVTDIAYPKLVMDSVVRTLM